MELGGAREVRGLPLILCGRNWGLGRYSRPHCWMHGLGQGGPDIGREHLPLRWAPGQDGLYLPQSIGPLSSWLQDNYP